MSAAVYAHPRFAPLPGKAKTPLWREIAAELAQRPGQWAAVAELVAAVKAVDRYGVECAVRTNGDGTATVWMRSVGTLTDMASAALVAYAEAKPERAGTTYKWFMGRRVVAP